MSAFSIIYALSTMLSLAYCYEYSFAVDMPAILNSFSNLATQAWSSSQAMISARASKDPDADAGSDADSDSDEDEEGPALVGKIQKVSMDVVGYMANILMKLSRRMTHQDKKKLQLDRKPNVEMGPGSFKTEQVSYPPNYFVNRLKTLLKLKKREDERNRPLNKPEK